MISVAVFTTWDEGAWFTDLGWHSCAVRGIMKYRAVIHAGARVVPIRKMANL